MSDTITAPSEQPAPEQAQAPTPGAQPTVTDPSTIAAGLDQEQLASLLYPTEEASQVIAPVETPAAPAAETPPAAGEKPVAPVEEGESSLRRLGLGGISMSERKTLAEVTRMIRDGEASTTVEALQKIGALTATPPAAETSPAAQATEETSQTPPAAEQPATSATIEQTIATLREQRKAAKADFDQDEEERLTSLIEDHGVALAEKRAEERIAAASSQTQARSYNDSYLEAVDAMEAKYDWTTDETSPLYQALDDKVTAARARNSSDLQDPNFIVKFADQIAETFGKPATVAKPPAPPATAPRIVGGGVAPGHSVANQPSPEEVRAIVNSLTEDQLAAALYG